MESLTPEELEKRKQRMERFGLPEDHNELRVSLLTAEDRDKQKERISRFGAQDKPHEYWQDPYNPSIERRLDSIYVFGVDYLSTKGVLRHFGAYSPEKVEWIDDSSCVVKFPSQDQVKEAFGNVAIKEFDEEANKAVKCLGYYHNEVEIPLYIRYATNSDEKPEDQKHSKYYQWINGRRRKQQNKRERRRDDKIPLPQINT